MSKYLIKNEKCEIYTPQRGYKNVYKNRLINNKMWMRNSFSRKI